MCAFQGAYRDLLKKMSNIHILELEAVLLDITFMFKMTEFIVSYYIRIYIYTGLYKRVDDIRQILLMNTVVSQCQ